MIIIKCKNLFTYPDGSIYKGQEILDFINYHTTHQTGKTKIATYVKKYKVAVDNNEKENAAKLLSETFSLIDSAVSKGTLQKATANRKKARLSVYGK